jgi:hypothetical protein
VNAFIPPLCGDEGFFVFRRSRFLFKRVFGVNESNLRLRIWSPTNKIASGKGAANGRNQYAERFDSVWEFGGGSRHDDALGARAIRLIRNLLQCRHGRRAWI